VYAWVKGEKVKGLDIYIPPHTLKPNQERFTIQSGVLTGNDTLSSFRHRLKTHYFQSAYPAP